MSDSEENIEKLELQVPSLSATAVQHAYSEALEAGLSVYAIGPIGNGNEQMIFEVFPDGTRNPVKAVEPPLRQPAGTTVQIP